MMVMAMRDWFIKDLGWKFFSLALAVTIWLTVNYKNQDESATLVRQATYNELPVMAISLPAGERAQISPPAITVTVSGPRERMATLQENEICPQINLSAVVAGHALRRSVEVAVPAGLTVISLNPAEVDVAVSPAAGEIQEKRP